MWKDFDTTFESILGDLGRQSDLLDKLAGLQHMVQSQQDSQCLQRLLKETEEHIKNYESDRVLIRQAIEDKNNDRARIHRAEVLVWISSAAMSDIHEEYCSKRQVCPRSGEWVLRKSNLEGWKDLDTPTNSILWMHGIPGAGKHEVSSISRLVAVINMYGQFNWCREIRGFFIDHRGMPKGVRVQDILLLLSRRR